MAVHLGIPQTADFQFCVVENVACYFCDTIDSYQMMLEHQKMVHSNESIIIVSELDRKKCAVCPYSGDSLIGHFEIEHELLLQLNNFNPLALNEDTINGLLKMNAQKCYCELCHEFFNTEDEAVQHHSVKHSEVNDVRDSTNDAEVKYLICSCQSKISCLSKYYSHIQDHFRGFECSKCEFHAINLIQLVEHDKNIHQMNTLKFWCMELSDKLMKYYFSTQIVFSNGLVLIMHNLLHTKYDISNQFNKIIAQVLGSNVEESKDISCDEKKNDREKSMGREKSKEPEKTKGNEKSKEREKPKGKEKSNGRAESKRREKSKEREKLKGKKKSKGRSQEKENKIKKEKNVKKKTSIKNARPNLVSRKKRTQELEAQNKYSKDLVVEGIPVIVGEDLQPIFLAICDKIDAKIVPNDIMFIRRFSHKTHKIIHVRLEKISTKLHILSKARTQTLMTADFIDLPPTMESTIIYINPYMTKYFCNLCKIAKAAVKDKKLYWYCLSMKGILVRRRRSSQGKHILSEGELFKYIEHTDKKNEIENEIYFKQNLAEI